MGRRPASAMGRASTWCDAVLGSVPPAALPVFREGFLRCCSVAGKIAAGSLCSGVDCSFKLLCLLLGALAAAAGTDPRPVELQHIFAFDNKASAQRWIRTCLLFHLCVVFPWPMQSIVSTVVLWWSGHESLLCPPAWLVCCALSRVRVWSYGHGVICLTWQLPWL